MSHRLQEPGLWLSTYSCRQLVLEYSQVPQLPYSNISWRLQHQNFGDPLRLIEARPTRNGLPLLLFPPRSFQAELSAMIVPRNLSGRQGGGISTVNPHTLYMGTHSGSPQAALTRGGARPVLPDETEEYVQDSHKKTIWGVKGQRSTRTPLGCGQKSHWRAPLNLAIRAQNTLWVDGWLWSERGWKQQGMAARMGSSDRECSDLECSDLACSGVLRGRSPQWAGALSRCALGSPTQRACLRTILANRPLVLQYPSDASDI